MQSKTLKASEKGLTLVDQARHRKGWNKYAESWCKVAHVAEGTLKRFWHRENILRENFMAICQAVDCDWQRVVELQEDPPVLESTCYIERPSIESRCYEAIQKPRELIRIKAPMGMGKTWLISKICDYAVKLDYQILRLNLLNIDAENITDLDKVLKWICRNAHRRLNLAPESQVDDIWDDAMGSKDNCTAYFEEQVLASLKHSLVLSLDNVDCVFPYPTIASEFLNLLRSWYDEAASGDQIWKQLRIVLSHATDDYPDLQVVHSPFNIGLPVELPEFTPEQVSALLSCYDISWQSSQIEQLMSFYYQ